MVRQIKAFLIGLIVLAVLLAVCAVVAGVLMLLLIELLGVVGPLGLFVVLGVGFGASMIRNLGESVLQAMKERDDSSGH